MAEIIKKQNFYKKFLYLTIINSISKIGNGHVENLFPKKMDRDLL